MSRALFVTVDAGGNLPPALTLARSLTARGHDVVFAGSPAQRSALGAFEFHSLPALAGWPDPRRPGSSLAVVRKYLWLAASRKLGEDVAEVIHAVEPDVVIVDCMMLTAARAAAASGARAVVLFHSLMSFWVGPWLHGPVGGLARLLGVDARAIWASADARLVTTLRELDDGALPDTRWIGTTETGVQATPAAGTPLVLVSLSSMHVPGQLGVYRRVIEALGTLPVRAIVTAGSGGLEDVQVPPNVEVRGYSDHGELMPQASLVITHGGHSTTLKALAHGLPVLVVPLHPALDQPKVGAAVAAARAGATLPPKTTPAGFAAAIAELLADPAYVAEARALGERIRATDAAGEASGIILGPLLSALP